MSCERLNLALVIRAATIQLEVCGSARKIHLTMSEFRLFRVDHPLIYLSTRYIY